MHLVLPRFNDMSHLQRLISIFRSLVASVSTFLLTKTGNREGSSLSFKLTAQKLHISLLFLPYRLHPGDVNIPGSKGCWEIQPLAGWA